MTDITDATALTAAEARGDAAEIVVGNLNAAKKIAIADLPTVANFGSALPAVAGRKPGELFAVVAGDNYTLHVMGAQPGNAKLPRAWLRVSDTSTPTPPSLGDNVLAADIIARSSTAAAYAAGKSLAGVDRIVVFFTVTFVSTQQTTASEFGLGGVTPPAGGVFRLQRQVPLWYSAALTDKLFFGVVGNAPSRVDYCLKIEDTQITPYEFGQGLAAPTNTTITAIRPVVAGG